MSDCNVLVATPKLRWFVKQSRSPYTMVLTVYPTLQQYFTDPLDVSGKGEWRDVSIVNENSTQPPILEN